MSELMKGVLSLSLSGSLVILALLLCGSLLRNTLSKRWQYYIWLVAVFRLLLPLAPEGSPVGALFQDQETAGLQAADSDALPPVLSLESGEAKQGAAESAPQPETAVTAGPAPVNGGRTVWDRLALVWLAGALLLLARRITSYQSFVRCVRAGWEEVSDPALLDRLAEIGERTGVRRPVELYVNRLVSSPLLLGLLRPAIVLPAALPEDDFTYTAAHELVHLRRRDMLCKWLVQIAVCLHWFNPLVWLMSREMGRSCELACDEAVLRALSPAERRAYGDTLIRAMEAGGGLPGSLGSIPLSGGGKLLKERLKAIMRYKKRSKFTAILSLLLSAVLIGGAASAGAYCGGGAEPVKEDAKTFRYTQEGYYQAPYLFEIGWNLTGEAADAYARTELPLPGGGAITVFYTEACAGVLEDAAAVSALAQVLSRLRRETADTAFPLTRPLVVSVRNTGDASPSALAEQSYEGGELPQFGAAFALLEEAGQRAMLDRIYEDGAVAFFSVALQKLDADSPLVDEFARRAYADERVNFFSILVNGHMDRQTREAWRDRAEADGRAGFRSVLLAALGEDRALEELKEELERQLAEEYARCGVTKEGADYYYQGQLVNLFVDPQPNGAVYTLSINPEGTVNIKIIRDGDGDIQRVELLPAEEAAALLADMAGEPEEDWDDDWDDDWDGDDGWDWDWDGGGDWDEDWSGVELGSGALPVELAAVKAGETVWLGEFDLAYGDRVQYDVQAEHGSDMQVGFARAEDGAPDTVYFSVHNYNTDRERGGLRCTASFAVKSPAEPGRYRLFLRSEEGELAGVSGGVSVTSSGGGEDGPVSLSPEDLPQTVREALDACADGRWYVLRYGGRQYVWHGGFAWSFGWRPAETEAGWRVDIVRFQKKDSGGLLLSLPEGALDLRVNGEAAAYTAVDCDTFS